MSTPILKNHVNGCHGNRAFFHSAFEFIFEDKSFFFCISGVPVNDLAPMKNCLGDVLCIVWHVVCRFCRDVAHIFRSMLLVSDNLF